MRILITNHTLDSRTGTETFVCDLAQGFLALGHDPVVFSPFLGPLAGDLRLAGVPVVDDLAKVPGNPDVIHGHHLHETLAAMLHFPQAPSIFVVHDLHSWHDIPPRLPQVRRYVAVDETRRDKLIFDHGIPSRLVQVIPNGVDTARFRPRRPLPEKPRRGLLFSNYVKHPRQYGQVREACERHGIDLQVAGSGVKRSTAEPNVLLPGYDLVFALGRSAMEAMAIGTGVILWGVEGLGGFVSRRNFEPLKSWNFGRHALGVASVDAVSREIESYRRPEAEWVRDHVRETCRLDQMVAAYLDVYAEVLEEAREHPVELLSTLESASRYLSECVPKVQVESLLGRRAARGTKRIMKLADAIPALVALALIQLNIFLFRLAGPCHMWGKIGLLTSSFGLLGWACYLRSWLRAKAGVLSRRGWGRLFRLGDGRKKERWVEGG